MKKFKSFEDAREFIQSLKLKNVRELESFRKSKQIPKDIPSSPKQIYKKEWEGWGDFLGTGVIQTQKRQYKTFEDVKKYVHSLNLKNREEWITWNKSNQISNDVPIAPQKVYKKEWEEYCKSGRKQNDIPSSPNSTYKNKGWTNWGDFLGTGVIQTQKRHYKNFDDVKKYVHSLNLKNREEWITWNKSNQISNDVPIAPQKVYKKVKTTRKYLLLINLRIEIHK